MKKGATPAEENEVNSSDAANRHLWLNKRTLTLGIAMMIGIGIGSGLMMPMITLYIAATFGLSMAITATVTSMRDMFKAPMEFVSGMLSDRFGRKPILVASFPLYALGFFVSVESGGMVFVYVGSIIAGIGAGCLIPAGLAYIGDIVPKEYEGRAMAIYWGLYSLGVAIGMIACGYCAQKMGYKNTILLGCGFLIAGSFIYWLGLEESVLRKSSAKHFEFKLSDMKFMVKNWNIMIVVYLTFFLAVERMDMPATLLPLFAMKGVGINLKDLGFSLFPVSLIAILSYPGGWIADKVGRKPGLIISLSIVAIGMFMFAATKNLTMLMLSSGVVFAGTGLGLPTLSALVNDIVPANIRGSAVGLTRVAWDLAMVAYPPVVLTIAQKWGWEWMWIVTGLSLVFGILITLTIKETRDTEA
ncbi:MAG: MFS transporter [Desulfobaccales bacterium]